MVEPNNRNGVPPDIGRIIGNELDSVHTWHDDEVLSFVRFRAAIKENGLELGAESAIKLYELALGNLKTEYIARKDLEIERMRIDAKRNLGASQAQLKTLRRARDLYPELKADLDKLLKDTGTKSLEDGEVSFEAAGKMLDAVAPKMKALGWRETKEG